MYVAMSNNLEDCPDACPHYVKDADVIALCGDDGVDKVVVCVSCTHIDVCKHRRDRWTSKTGSTTR